MSGWLYVSSHGESVRPGQLDASASRSCGDGEVCDVDTNVLRHELRASRVVMKVTALRA